MPAQQATDNTNAATDESGLQLRVDAPHAAAAQPAAAAGERVSGVSSVNSTAERAAHASAGGHDRMAATIDVVRPDDASHDDPSLNSPDAADLQVEQIAERLGEQLRDLDRREAALHAQLAAQESADRAARHWLRERQHELNQRQAELDERETAIEERRAELTKEDGHQAEATQRAKADQRRMSEAFAARQRDLEAREQGLAEREEQLAAATTAFEQAQAEQDAQQYAAAGKLAERQKNLEESEALLADSQNTLAEERRRLHQQRSQWLDRERAERQRLKADQAKLRQELDGKGQFLLSRAESLDRRAAALDQLRDEVSRAHRETLDLRLATDELWAQLCGECPPAELAQSLARIRSQIADAAANERKQLDADRRQLELALSQLADEREELKRGVAQLDALSVDRRQDLAEDYERLAEREALLDTREQHIDQQIEQLRVDRTAYEREIRRLLGQLRADV